MGKNVVDELGRFSEEFRSGQPRADVGGQGRRHFHWDTK